MKSQAAALISTENATRQSVEIACNNTVDKGNGVPDPQLPCGSPAVHGGPGEQSVQTAVFESYCAWFTQNFRGIEATMERIDPSGSVVEFHGRPLVGIDVHTDANNVTAIRLTFATNSHERVFDISGVKALHIERDAAGFPMFLELRRDDETIVLRFTGAVRSAPTYSRNSWGE